MTIKIRWEMMQSEDKDFIFKVAESRGWYENKVQVRKIWEDKREQWVLEPFEKDCRCPDIVPPPSKSVS